MPETTPFVKVGRHAGPRCAPSSCTATTRRRGHGARDTSSSTREGRTFVHPFDDPHVIAGQGTRRARAPRRPSRPRHDRGARRRRRPARRHERRVPRARRPTSSSSACRRELYPSMARALAGDSTTLSRRTDHGRRHRRRRRPACSRPRSAARGRRRRGDGQRARDRGGREPASSRSRRSSPKAPAPPASPRSSSTASASRGKRVGVVLTGGNIDPRLLSSVILRGLVHTGRLSRLRVWLDDRPGSLSQLTGVVGAAGGNIVEVRPPAPVRRRHRSARTEVELAVETMDRAHADTVIAALEDAGYRVDSRRPIDRADVGSTAPQYCEERVGEDARRGGDVVDLREDRLFERRLVRRRGSPARRRVRRARRASRSTPRAIHAATSAPNPDVRMSSCTTSARPVFATDSATSSWSHGTRQRRSMISTDAPSSSAPRRPGATVRPSRRT